MSSVVTVIFCATLIWVCTYKKLMGTIMKNTGDGDMLDTPSLSSLFAGWCTKQLLLASHLVGVCCMVGQAHAQRWWIYPASKRTKRRQKWPACSPLRQERGQEVGRLEEWESTCKWALYFPLRVQAIPLTATRRPTTDSWEKRQTTKEEKKEASTERVLALRLSHS